MKYYAEPDPKCDHIPEVEIQETIFDWKAENSDLFMAMTEAAAYLGWKRHLDLILGEAAEIVIRRERDKNP